MDSNQRVDFLERGYDETFEDDSLSYRAIDRYEVPTVSTDPTRDPWVRWRQRRDADAVREAERIRRDADPIERARRSQHALRGHETRRLRRITEAVERERLIAEKAARKQSELVARLEAERIEHDRRLARWIDAPDDTAAVRGIEIVTYPWEPRDRVVAALSRWLDRWPVVTIQRTDTDRLSFRVDGAGVCGIIEARVIHGRDVPIQWTRLSDMNARATWTSHGIKCKIEIWG